MNRSSFMLVLVLITAATACGPENPEPVAPVDTTPTQAVPPPPAPEPPQKKCEALEEGCPAKSGTKARIAGSTMVIEPVSGWTYAQGEKFTLSQLGDEQACLVVIGHDVPDPKKLNAVYQAQLEALTAALKITGKLNKLKWTLAGTLPGGKVPLSRWVVEDVKRNNQQGNLLIVATQPADGKAVFGIAFVPSDHDEDAEKVLTSFSSLGPPSTAPSAAPSASPAAGSASPKAAPSTGSASPKAAPSTGSASPKAPPPAPKAGGDDVY